LERRSTIKVYEIVHKFDVSKQLNMAKKLLSLNVQHNYITLKTPNGNFTVSRSGYKATGKLASSDKAFKAILNFFDTRRKAGYNNGEVMNMLADEKILVSLWPDWNSNHVGI
jgi:hypothetical protein